jgi:hypothetical protein
MRHNTTRTVFCFVHSSEVSKKIASQQYNEEVDGYNSGREQQCLKYKIMSS